MPNGTISLLKGGGRILPFDEVCTAPDEIVRMLKTAKSELCPPLVDFDDKQNGGGF